MSNSADLVRQPRQQIVVPTTHASRGRPRAGMKGKVAVTVARPNKEGRHGR